MSDASGEAEVGFYRVEVMDTGVPGMKWVHVWDSKYPDPPAISISLSSAQDLAEAIQEAANDAAPLDAKRECEIVVECRDCDFGFRTGDAMDAFERQLSHRADTGHTTEKSHEYGATDA